MPDSTVTDNSNEAQRREWGIGSQLLLSVNGVLMLLATAFLLYDYQRGIGARLEDKRIALQEEAKSLMPAVLLMQQHGSEGIQRYVDAVCGTMRDTQSPGHHIVVENPTKVIQASAHHRASPEMLTAIRSAVDKQRHRASKGSNELVVGVYAQGDTTIYVSETLKNIRRAVIGDVILRLMGLVILALVATAVVDYVLWRVIWRPIRRLVLTVQGIAGGNLGVQTEPFRSRELGYLADEINAMSTSLAAVDRERASQMVRAREIQQSLLPNDVNLEGLNLSSLFLPAEDVAGDYFDVITLQDGTHVVCIADVTGHGVPAALSAMMLKVLLAEACEHHADPSDILEYINRRLAGVCRTDGFVTMFVARFDLENMVLDYASAGHESGLLLSAEGELSELPSTGLILGIVEDASWTTETITIQPSDRLLLVTDGVTEAMNPKEQVFGRKKLAETFKANRDLETGQALEAIGTAVADYCEERPFSDDVTLLALEVIAESSTDHSPEISSAKASASCSMDEVSQS